MKESLPPHNFFFCLFPTSHIFSQSTSTSVVQLIRYTASDFMLETLTEAEANTALW